MNLSLCCISNILKEKDIKFRTMTYKTFSSKPREESLEKLSLLVINNLKTTREIIYHCNLNNIRGYRFSSDLFPVINHPEVMMDLSELPHFNIISLELNNITRAIRETGIRVSAHPSEYITLTSDDPKAISNSINDLELHAKIFDLLEIPKDHSAPLNIHCRKDGEPNEISGKFIMNFEKLSSSVKSRLVIENNDNTSGVWSIENLYKYFYKTINTPITFDILHHKMLPGNLSERAAFDLAYSSWSHTPLFHYSEGKNNTRAHCDMAENLPPQYTSDIYWDVELKNKDIAILDILRRLENGN